MEDLRNGDFLCIKLFRFVLLYELSFSICTSDMHVCVCRIQYKLFRVHVFVCVGHVTLSKVLVPFALVFSFFGEYYRTFLDEI